MRWYCSIKFGIPEPEKELKTYNLMVRLEKQAKRLDI